MKRFSILFLVAVLGLGSCSTIGKVRSILPFQESDEEKQLREQGESPDENQRISVLLFEQSLEPDPELVGSVLVLPRPYVNSDWAQSGGFPSHAPQHLQAVDEMKLDWKRKVGKKSDKKGRIMAPPVIAGNRMFVMDARGGIRALDLESGSIIWKIKLKAKRKKADKKDRQGMFSGGFRGVADKMRNRSSEGYGGGLAVSGGRLLITSGFAFATALDVNSGEELWRTETPTPLHTAPSVADGRMFVVSQDDELITLDIETGEILWTFQGIVETARLLSSSSAAIYGEVVVAPFASGELGAFRVQNGRSIWTEALTRSAGLNALSALNDIAANPVVFDNTVYAISHSGLLVAVDLKTGQRLWSRQVGGIHMPWIAGNTLFILTNDAEVAAVSRTTGKVIWMKQMRQYKKIKKRKNRIAWAGPILVSNRLLLVSSRGDVVKLSPQTGEEMDRLKYRDSFFVTPVIAGGKAYIISDNAKVYALQ
ncbi:Outer membrane protein YfgL, lipoprotein component of the protein assembly complex (forms a complex with YaeT, YfiO, and NlpB) [hydrothermal vent metagenome]|uniref:Outer membrane protein YfgL, lipoprotein component of the protein assembly complex (Forms a complex with YaeT, YfiO, and NlpB) n=1 Tax=hydrothermal vent metagenome TaxID=652676 RepID=A0A3B0RS48_9ZZZZ